jgi:hypothetical protein
VQADSEGKLGEITLPVLVRRVVRGVARMPVIREKDGDAGRPLLNGF